LPKIEKRNDMRLLRLFFAGAQPTLIVCVSFLTLFPFSSSPRTIGLLLLFIAIFILSVFRFVDELKSRKSLLRLRAVLLEVTRGNYNARFRSQYSTFVDDSLSRVNSIIELLENARADSIRSESARKRLLSDISHDIRTPLTSIIGYIGALKDDIASDGAERDEYIEILIAKSRALKSMIEDVFSLAKLDADEIPMNRERIDACELVREAVIEFLPEFRSAGIELVADIPDDALYVSFDRISLDRIVWNLVQNAFVHGRETRCVRVTVSSSASDAVSIAIADRGRGIAPEDLSLVFTRLYRRDSARASRGGGSGLGLAIVQSLAAKNSSTVKVSSDLGGETVFTVVIPRY
jgi:signal transduction histidine kinase